MARPFAVPVILADADREVLLRWSRRPNTAQAMALRARIVLAAAEPGLTSTAIAVQLGTTTMSVAKWRGRFAEKRAIHPKLCSTTHRLGSILTEERQIGSHKGPFFIRGVARVRLARRRVHACEGHPGSP